MEKVMEEPTLQFENISKKKAFWQNPKIPIVVALVVVGMTILAGGWWVWKNYQPVEEVLEGKYCKQDSDCIYGWPEKCIMGCVNKYTPKRTLCPLIKPAVWSSYVWNHMPCKCSDNECEEDKEAFCQKACEDWVNSNCVDGIPKSAFLATKCEDRIECNCLKQDQITITTDKTEYEVGDSIVIRVKNGLGKDICFGACSNCPSCHAYNLERKEGDEGYEVVKRWSCGKEMNIVGEHLKPGESTEFTTYYISQNPQKTARYRAAVLLSFDCSRISFELAQTAYSNEFTIKKLDLPLVLEKVNFYTYPSGEIVLGDGENIGKTLVKRDLDGDGKEEEVYVDKVRFPEGIGFVLHIGRKSQKTDFWATDFSVVDIDESDGYQEVVLHNPGPSNDDVSLFFWYNGQEIKEMGKLARWPKILGNGEVKVADWMGFWAKTDTYLLNEETHLLEWVPKETYEVGIKTKALGTIRLYEEKSYDSRVVKEIKRGEEVEILLAEGCDTYFCEWFQLEAGGIKGWAKQGDFEYRLELSHAD